MKWRISFFDKNNFTHVAETYQPYFVFTTDLTSVSSLLRFAPFRAGSVSLSHSQTSDRRVVARIFRSFLVPCRKNKISCEHHLPHDLRLSFLCNTRRHSIAFLCIESSETFSVRRFFPLVNHTLHQYQSTNQSTPNH